MIRYLFTTWEKEHHWFEQFVVPYLRNGERISDTIFSTLPIVFAVTVEPTYEGFCQAYDLANYLIGTSFACHAFAIDSVTFDIDEQVDNWEKNYCFLS